MEAAQEGHIDIVKYLIMKKADVHAVTSTADSPLTYAAANGHTAICDILISCGANVVRNRGGREREREGRREGGRGREEREGRKGGKEGREGGRGGGKGGYILCIFLCVYICVKQYSSGVWCFKLSFTSSV